MVADQVHQEAPIAHQVLTALLVREVQVQVLVVVQATELPMESTPIRLTPILDHLTTPITQTAKHTSHFTLTTNLLIIITQQGTIQQPS